MARHDSRAPRPTPPVPAELVEAFARLNGRAWGIAAGSLAGLGLLAATWLLLIEGGPTVGQHLGLLAHIFPGYSVSVVGGLIGFVYAFVVGYAFGRLLGEVYNRLVPSMPR
jgi:hypothetical protein